MHLIRAEYSRHFYSFAWRYETCEIFFKVHIYCLRELPTPQLLRRFLNPYLLRIYELALLNHKTEPTSLSVAYIAFLRLFEPRNPGHEKNIVAQRTFKCRAHHFRTNFSHLQHKTLHTYKLADVLAPYVANLNA